MDTEIIREHYNNNLADEWARIDNRPEFLMTCRMLNRHIKPGDKVLDIGGGPGRYSLYLAEKGCDVTLYDLSEANTNHAAEKAAERGLQLRTITGDARIADNTLAKNQFDHVLLMGPLYHLLEEADRIKATQAAVNLAKPGGLLYAAFINMTAGMIYAMREAPDILKLPEEVDYINCFIEKRSYAGDGFTRVFFAEMSEILPFMSKFPLEKLHLFGQESIMFPCEDNIMAQPQDIVDKWLDLCEKIWEREELLSFSEHLMYIGRKV